MMNSTLKLKLNKDQEVFFFSDPHYGHFNIVKGISHWDVDRTGTQRDFEIVEQMNKVIVDKFNSTVGENDIAFCLGDWAFGGILNILEFRDRLNCKNIYLITGNHDEKIEKNQSIPEDYEFKNHLNYNTGLGQLQDLFIGVYKYLELEVIFPQVDKHTKQRRHSFNLFHFPIHSYNFMGRGRRHLFGHIHSKKENRLVGRSLDVGLDGNNFYPYSIDQVIELIGDNNPERVVLNFDHHE